VKLRILIVLVRLARKWLRWRASRGSLTESGYIKLRETNQYEHRAIAEKWLKRQLRPEEVVHHINGNPRDNRPINLCVLYDDAHDKYHSWLSWKRSKEGKYPNDRYQRAVLRKRYKGILIGDV